MSRRIGRRAAISLALLVAALLLGVVIIEASNGSVQSTLSTPVPTQGGPSSGSPYPVENLTQYVNPFIGTGDSPSPPCEAACDGDTFPGAAYPMGMVQWSPDTVSNPAGGYYYNDSVIKDFSLTHFSGRGCNVYQDFPFMPYVGSVSSSPEADPSLYYSGFSHANETARPGYYSVHLDGPDVTVDLSVTPHTGVGRFVYPPSTSSTMLINAGGSINGNSNSAVTVLPSQDEVTGSAQSVVGCDVVPYVIYFAAKFDHPFASYGTWNGDALGQGSASASGQHTGAFLVFDTTADQAVGVQVGISFVSVANAQSNLAAEGLGFSVEKAAEGAASAWNAALNTIQVGGGTQDENVTFYTALYHVFLHPNVFSDDNGEYLGFDGKVHTVQAGHAQYENVNGWDDYRTQIRLLSVLEPSVVSDIAQSLVNDAEQGNGAIPRWEQANVDSGVMSGDSGDAVIAEAYAFGARGFDATAALNSMIVGQAQTREGFTDYVDIGYVAADNDPDGYSASITLEYANDDFAIAQLANALGNTTVYDTYLQRSGNWQNLFNSATGYIEPRDFDGSWAAEGQSAQYGSNGASAALFDPTSDYGFQEGDSAQYTWLVTYNLKGLFADMGGNATAVGRLDAFFSQLNVGPSSPYAWMGNEPSVEVPWEYDFAQAPAQTQEVVREIESQLWTDSPGGIPGNDDGGEMSSWYVFAAIGLYPEITGVGGFVIGSPLFPSVTVHLSGGHSIQIDAPQASPAQPYVQGLEFDGAPTSSLWVPWTSVAGGATLDFSLGSTPSTWGSAPQDAPPSYPSLPG